MMKLLEAVTVAWAVVVMTEELVVEAMVEAMVEATAAANSRLEWLRDAGLMFSSSL